MRKLRVAALMLKDFVPPDSIEGLSDKEIAPYKMEYDVTSGLEELGHDVRIVAVDEKLGDIREALRDQNPHVVFNLLEEFQGVGTYVPYVLGYLEMIKQPYTGCNPYGLMLTHNKAVAKKILRHHRIRGPEFTVFPRRRKVIKPARLKYPLFVKSATEHGSIGIAQASVVYDEEKLMDRVSFVHDQLQTDALVEEYIDGREIYVGVIGNKQLRTFAPWEMHFANLPEGAPRVATSKVKWDQRYQRELGVATRAAELSDDLARRIHHTCKRVYRVFEQSGYARLDLRVTEDEKIYVLESNPNPQLEYGEDFAESAEACGVSYVELIQRILSLGLNHKAPWRE